MDNLQTDDIWFPFPPPPLPFSADSKHIRVLKVAPPINANDQDIRVEIEVIELTENARFSALSYVWGTSEGQRKTIRCGTHSLPISRNCWSALWHLRNGYYSDDHSFSSSSLDTMTIWVDAICINQRDISEKERQILLMVDIYSWAERVYVWLGDGTAASDAAIDFFKVAGFQDILAYQDDFRYQIPQAHRRIAWNYFAQQWSTFLAILWQQGRHIPFDKLGSATVTNVLSGLREAFSYCKLRSNRPDTLQDFFSREWASRIWTLQEILLSPRPVICCGTKALPWRNFIHSVAFLNTFFPLFDPFGLQKCDTRWHGVVTLWTHLHDSKISQNYTAKYHDFLQQVRNLYSIIHILWAIVLAMVSAVASHTLRVFYFKHNHDSPNYLILTAIILNMLSVAITSYGMEGFFFDRELPAIEPHNVMIHEIITRQAMNPKDISFGVSSILSRVGPKLKDPNYTRSLQDIHRELLLHLLASSKSLNLLLLADSTRALESQPSWVPNWTIPLNQAWLGPKTLIGQGYHGIPSRETKGLFKLRGEDELIIRGREVRRITWHCGRFCETSLDYKESEQSLHLHNITMIQDLIKQNTQAFRNALKTTYAFAFLNLKTKDVKTKEDYWEKKDQLSQWGEIMAKSECRSNPSRNALELLRSKPSMMRFHASLCNDLSIKRRTFFHTDLDRLGLGNGPANIAVDDVLVLVDGISMPLVLRAQDQESTYRLIGFAEMEQLQKLCFELGTLPFFLKETERPTWNHHSVWLNLPEAKQIIIR